jgi:thiol-disulfide isomerase/thioredoxin
MLALLALALLAAAPSPAAPARLAPAPAAATAQDLQAVVRAAKGRVVLVNAWATWCVPCREEMPDLLRLRKELGPKGFGLVLVSADFDSAVGDARAWLGSMGVDFPTWHKTQRDQDFIDGLDPSWTGSLPYSALYGRDGRRLASWEGRETYEAMKSRIEGALKVSP